MRKYPKWLIPPMMQAQEEQYTQYFVAAVRKWRNGIIPEIKRVLKDTALLDSIRNAPEVPEEWRIRDAWEDDLDSFMGFYFTEVTADLISRQMPGVIASVNQLNRTNWVETVSRVTNVPLQAVDPMLTEPWLERVMEQRVAENVDLIKDVGEQTKRNISRTIRDDVRSGLNTKVIAKKLEEELDGAETRAELIARDQIQKHNGALHQERQQDAGVDEYIWRDSGDVRVRKLHQQYNGQTYKWSKPPDDGHPGQAVLCRCVASPVIPASLYDLPVDDEYLSFEEY